MAAASGRTSLQLYHNEGWAFANTTALDTEPQRCILLCGLEQSATDKCTTPINAAHAHLASLTRAADGRTAGQPLPSEIWSLITKRNSRADYILAKIPSKTQKMVIGNSRTSSCCPNKCPVSQHLAGWQLCLVGNEPTYMLIRSVDTEQVQVSGKNSQTVWQMSLSHHSSVGNVRSTLWQSTENISPIITNKAGVQNGKMLLS